MSLYKLPVGIRIPNNDEYPNNYDVKSINEKRNKSNIIEGYTIKEVTGNKFTYYIEANVDSDKIWDLFCAITNKIVGDIAYGILGFKDEEPKLSNFTTSENIINIFKNYSFELVNDGYLQFGIAYYDDNSLNEIFVSSFKYMKIWTNKMDLLLDTLNKYGIRFVENLQFIDEFPVVSKALSCDEFNEVSHYTEVLRMIEQKFECL